MNTKTINLPQYKHLFYILCAISIASLFVYIYCINMTVRNVVVRSSIEKQLTKVTSANSEKEFEYIAEKNTIDMSKALSMGFKPTNQEIFVSRQPSVAFVDVNVSQ